MLEQVVQIKIIEVVLMGDGTYENIIFNDNKENSIFQKTNVI